MKLKICHIWRFWNTVSIIFMKLTILNEVLFQYLFNWSISKYTFFETACLNTLKIISKSILKMKYIYITTKKKMIWTVIWEWTIKFLTVGIGQKNNYSMKHYNAGKEPNTIINIRKWLNTSGFQIVSYIFTNKTSWLNNYWNNFQVK